MGTYQMECFLKDLNENSQDCSCLYDDCNHILPDALLCDRDTTAKQIRYLQNASDDVTVAKEVDRWVDILVDVLASLKGSSFDEVLKVLRLKHPWPILSALPSIDHTRSQCDCKKSLIFN